MIDPLTRIWADGAAQLADVMSDLIAVDTATPDGAVWVVHFEVVQADPTRRLARSLSGFLAGIADQFDQGEYAWDEIEGLVAVDGLSVVLHED